jgi:hypothetical protein
VILDRFRWWWLFFALALGIVGGYFGGHSQRGPGVNGDAGEQRSAARETDTQAEVEPLVSASLEQVDASTRLGMLERIAATDLAGLPALCRELLAGEDSRTALIPLMDRWVELDAEAGFSFFGSNEAGLSGISAELAAAEYCGRWSLADPDRAAQGAQGMVGRDQHVALDRVSHVLAAYRPEDFFRIRATSETSESCRSGDDTSNHQGVAAWPLPRFKNRR